MSKPSMNAVTRGRPCLLTPEVVDTLCERLADGESLRSICRSPDMPSTQSVRAWLKRGSQEQEGVYRELLAHYALARDLQIDWFIEEVTDLMRDLNQKNAAAKRLAFNAIKWRAGQLAPKRYGKPNTSSHGTTVRASSRGEPA